MSVFSRLDPRIQKALARLKIKEPSEAQRHMIPDILQRKQVLLVAPTGIGKTEAAMLPIMDDILKAEHIRYGECNNCGACCKMPVRCVFLWNSQCSIHHNRPKQCRNFPARPKDMVSKKCGYWFEEQ